MFLPSENSELTESEIVDILGTPHVHRDVPVPASWSLPPVLPDCQSLLVMEDMGAGDDSLLVIGH